MDEKEQTSTEWCGDTAVSVTRLAGRGKAMARAMGVGVLLDGLDVGRPFRIRLDEGHLLAVSELISIQSLNPQVVRIETRNHDYELRRIAGTPSPQGRLAIHDNANPPSARASHSDTQVVRVDDWPAAQPSRFEEGARVQVVQSTDGEMRELGSGILLAPLSPGENLSLAIGDGVLGTSEVRGIRHLGKHRIEVVTENSRYGLTLIVDDDHEAGNADE